MIKIKDLNKTFGNYHVLHNLNLSIDEGELFGFVGPNGAGKTTTMRILAGLTKADSGSVEIDGMDITKNKKKLQRSIGYMPDYFGVYDNLTIMEYMDFFASTYGIFGNGARKKILEKLDLVKLNRKETVYVNDLSRGMQQRLCLARCMLHDPKLLILDEPASGLDAKAYIDLREILQQLKDEKKTVLISSHILPELSKMCTSIGIIQEGTMQLCGTVDDIMTKFYTANPIAIDLVAGQEKALAILKERELVETVTKQGNRLYVRFSGNPMHEAELLQEMISQGVMISSFGRVEGNLESLFIQITDQERGV